MSPRNFPAGRAVLGGWIARTPSSVQGPACGWAFDCSLLLWKGIFKDQLSWRASPPLCHPLWKLSGFRPELSQLPRVLASCCVRLYLGICRAAALGARVCSDLGRGRQYCQNRAAVGFPPRSCPLPSLCVCSRFPGRGDCTIVCARLAAGLGCVTALLPWHRCGGNGCPAGLHRSTDPKLQPIFCAFLFIHVLIVRNCYNNLFVSW